MQRPRRRGRARAGGGDRQPGEGEQDELAGAENWDEAAGKDQTPGAVDEVADEFILDDQADGQGDERGDDGGDDHPAKDHRDRR